MSQVLDIQVEVPDAVSEQNLKIAEAVARQAVIIALQQRGELSIREAAAALNLPYEEYLQLLAQDGLGLSRFEQDQSVLQQLRQSSPNHFPSHS
jgi:predicted HTH domain antitoxin